MGTHPIFESDFDCLTEVIMSDLIGRLVDKLGCDQRQVNATRKQALFAPYRSLSVNSITDAALSTAKSYEQDKVRGLIDNVANTRKIKKLSNIVQFLGLVAQDNNQKNTIQDGTNLQNNSQS